MEIMIVNYVLCFRIMVAQNLSMYYVCTYMYVLCASIVCTYMYVYMYVCMYVRMYVCMYVYMYACVSTYVHMCVCMHVCMQYAHRL